MSSSEYQEHMVEIEDLPKKARNRQSNYEMYKMNLVVPNGNQAFKPSPNIESAYWAVSSGV